MTVDGGIYAGTAGTDRNCNNCGHPSHCGGPLYEDAWNEYGRRLGRIEICKSCTCNDCSTKDISECKEIT